MREKYPLLDIYLTGGVMIDNAFGEVPERDMRSLIPMMFALLLLLIGLSLRSMLATISTLLVILFSAITGLGLAGWLGIVLTPASATAPIIILTLAVADSVHILVTVFHKMRGGAARHHAIQESIRVNFQPVLITSVSTAIGFLTMNFSDAPPFRDLGNIVAMGVLIAFVLSVTFLPALIMLLPGRQQTGETVSSRLMGSFAEFVIAKRRRLLVGMGRRLGMGTTFLTCNHTLFYSAHRSVF